MVKVKIGLWYTLMYDLSICRDINYICPVDKRHLGGHYLLVLSLNILKFLFFALSQREDIAKSILMHGYLRLSRTKSLRLRNLEYGRFDNSLM